MAKKIPVGAREITESVMNAVSTLGQINGEFYWKEKAEQLELIKKTIKKLKESAALVESYM